MLITAISLLFLSSLIIPYSFYCLTPIANPSFSSGPLVQQVSMNIVKVSWHGIVDRLDCVDQFIVKHWLKSDSNEYDLSEMMATSVYKYQVEGLMPDRAYAFQIVAREDKGHAGSDWNKSPVTHFATSRNQSTVPPITEPIVFLSKPGTGPKKYPPALRTYEQASSSKFGFVVIVGIVVGALLGLLVLSAVVYNLVKLVRTNVGGEDSEGEE